MRKNKITFTAIVLTMMVIGFGSCTKSSVTSTDLVGNWMRGSEFDGVGRTEAVSFTIGDKVYLGGGYDGTTRLSDFWEFNQSTSTWIPKANFPGIARNSAVAFSVNGKGYVGTGFDGTNKLKDFWEYDPATDTWTQKANFGGTARYGAVAFAIGNKGYITTGYDGNYMKDLWEYDPTTNAWTQKASLGGSKRADASAFVYNNKAFVLAGANNGSYLNDFWVYDPATDSWAEKRKVTNVSDESYDDDYGTDITRSNASIFVMGVKAYLTMGNRNGIVATCWEYDITNDTWVQKTSFEGTAREGAISFTINDRGYTTTGNTSSSRFDDLWEFFPNQEVNDNDN